MLGAVIRRFRDFAASEDAVQEALLAAALQWPEEGVPDNPRGWLIQVAARRMTDHLRTELARRRRETVVVMQAPAHEQVPPSLAEFGSSFGAASPEVEQDDTLILLFMCCHPALTRTSAIALTLRAVGGLTTAEIASAFLVPEATMAQRISRAKQRIRTSGVPFRMPTDVRARGTPECRAARALPHLQRGLHEQRRARRCSAAISRTRRSGSPGPWSISCRRARKVPRRRRACSR